jgi:hypothetical protein
MRRLKRYIEEGFGKSKSADPMKDESTDHYITAQMREQLRATGAKWHAIAMLPDTPSQAEHAGVRYRPS